MQRLQSQRSRPGLKSKPRRLSRACLSQARNPVLKCMSEMAMAMDARPSGRRVVVRVQVGAA